MYSKNTLFLRYGRSGVKSSDFCILHGLHSVEACVTSGKRSLRKLLLAPKALSKNTRATLKCMSHLMSDLPRQRLSVANLNKITQTTKNQGMALVASQRLPDETYSSNIICKALAPRQDSSPGPLANLFIFIAGHIDNYSLGSIIRISSFYAVDAIFLMRPKVLSDAIVNSAACGSVDSMYFVDCSSQPPKDIVKNFRTKGFIAVHLDSHLDDNLFTNARTQGKVLLVVGLQSHEICMARPVTKCDNGMNAKGISSSSVSILREEAAAELTLGAQMAMYLERFHKSCYQSR